MISRHWGGSNEAVQWSVTGSRCKALSPSYDCCIPRHHHNQLLLWLGCTASYSTGSAHISLMLRSVTVVVQRTHCVLRPTSISSGSIVVHAVRERRSTEARCTLTCFHQWHANCHHIDMPAAAAQLERCISDISHCMFVSSSLELLRVASSYINNSVLTLYSPVTTAIYLQRHFHLTLVLINE